MYERDTAFFSPISTALQIADRLGSEEITYCNWLSILTLYYGQQMDIEKREFFDLKKKILISRQTLKA